MTFVEKTNQELSRANVSQRKISNKILFEELRLT